MSAVSTQSPSSPSSGVGRRRDEYLYVLANRHCCAGAWLGINHLPDSTAVLDWLINPGPRQLEAGLLIENLQVGVDPQQTVPLPRKKLAKLGIGPSSERRNLTASLASYTPVGRSRSAMTTEPQSTSPTALLRGSWSLFAALALLLLGNGLLGSLIGIRAELEGFDTVLTGVVLAFYFIGFIVGTQVAPIAVTRVGHVRVFAGLASLASAATLLHAVTVNPVAWIVGRAVVGTCIAGLYVVAESWLNASATNKTRGRLLSMYMVVVMGAIGTGQLLLTIADPLGFGLFILATALMALSIVPITLSVAPAPSFDLPTRMRLRELWHASPVGLAGSLGAGLANGAAFAMGPVYGLSIGMSVDRVSVLMGTMVLGAVVLQWPIGTWSDRVQRRRSIVAVNLAAAATAVVVAAIDPNSAWLFVAVFLFGATTFPVYSLSLSHVNDVLEPHQILAASSVFVLVWGLGSIFGPIIASILMSTTGPEALFWMMGAVHLGVAAYAIFRITVKEGVAISDQESYLHVPARASGLIGVLTRGRRPR